MRRRGPPPLAVGGSAPHAGSIMFRDRRHAGELLGEALVGRGLPDPVVLGLPRGGVVVAAGVAAALDAPLDIVVVRKLGAPGNPELGVGAVAEGEVTVLNEGLMRRLGMTGDQLDDVARREHAELLRRRAVYRRSAEPPSLAGRTAIVVDDGLATGYTARAAVEAVRRRRAERPMSLRAIRRAIRKATTRSMQPVAALAVAIALVGAAWPLAAARADERPAMEPEVTKSREPKVFLFDDEAVRAVADYVAAHNVRRGLAAARFAWVTPLADRRSTPGKPGAL